MLDGFPIAEKFSSRRLRQFIPRRGTELERMQTAMEDEWRRREEEEDRTDGTGEGFDLDTRLSVVGKGESTDTAGKHSETEGTNQPFGSRESKPLDTSSGRDHSQATRPLLTWGVVHVVVDIAKDTPHQQSDQAFKAIRLEAIRSD